MVADLKRQGVTVAEVVRAALRSEYSRRRQQPPSAPADLLEWLHEKYPPPSNYRRRRLDTTDRKQVAAFLRSRFRKQRPGSDAQ